MAFLPKLERTLRKSRQSELFLSVPVKHLGIQAMVSGDKPGAGPLPRPAVLGRAELPARPDPPPRQRPPRRLPGHPAAGQAWGGGELASADGLRFVTPIRTLNSGPNPKYFAARGITFYNFLSDQYSGLHGILIPGTRATSFYILDGLLEQETALRPVEITSDTHGSSEMVFGLFRLLGYQFSPRLADSGSATLLPGGPGRRLRAAQPADPRQVNIKRITSNWDDVLRVAGSLHSGTIKASEVLRVLAPGGKPTPTGKAIMEIGRLDRSAYLSSYFTTELLRRHINTQLNRQESRHNLARRIFYGGATRETVSVG